MKIRQRIAVRTLVESVMRSGDLELTFMGSVRPLEGIRAHQKIQRSRPPGYIAEMAVSHEVDWKTITLVIGGRIDGVNPSAEPPLVEEIKTTTRDLETLQKKENPLHWGQVKVYAHLYTVEHSLERITAQLTYIHLDSGETAEKQRQFDCRELEAFFDDLVARYLCWAETVGAWLEARDTSIQALSFPFENYRPGQRQMAVAVYRAIRDQKELMVEAATGIGKTMGAVFPALKALAQGLISKIFFLTARTTGKHAAEQATAEMRRKGLRLKSLTLTAKDKICLSPEATCTAAECDYAKGYYDRIDAAVEAVFGHDALTRETITRAAVDHRVCPFEFSLELSLWADCIICDYNYAFDPRVYLRRFFEEQDGAYVFLVDEAHNLPDRSREMFSAAISKQPFLDVRKPLKKDLPRLYRNMGRINRAMVEYRSQCHAAGGSLVEKIPPAGIFPLLRGFLKSAEGWLAQNVKTAYRQDLLELYFNVSNFLRVADAYDDTYATLFSANGKDLELKLFCIDPSGQMRTALERCRSVVFFSATLTPADYYRHLCGCSPGLKQFSIPSPFPRENLRVFVAGRISTLYTRRDSTKAAVGRVILSLVRRRPGNYLAFFPSYEYMTMVHEQVTANDPDLCVLLQTPGMSEPDRDRFLAHFDHNHNHTLVGFVVMGGIFAEGIDLAGDRLTGAAVVGVGLPGIGPQRELIRDYFDESDRRGFDYAYRYPGIVRVFQAAGRVIRSERDRGVVLLIDQRFTTARYQALMPRHWQTVKVADEKAIEDSLEQFW